MPIDAFYFTSIISNLSMCLLLSFCMNKLCRSSCKTKNLSSMHQSRSINLARLHILFLELCILCDFFFTSILLKFYNCDSYYLVSILFLFLIFSMFLIYYCIHAQFILPILYYLLFSFCAKGMLLLVTNKYSTCVKD